MSRQIRRLSLQQVHLQITIGIILIVTTHYGPHLTRPNQFTIHVQPVGVFPTAEVMAFGQRPWVHRHILLTHHYTAAPIKA